MDDEDAPTHEAMRINNPAQRRNPMTDDKKSSRRVRKESLTLPSQRTSAYSSPGYYVVDKYGAAQDGPFNTYSLAIANLNGRDGIQYMDQAKAAPLNEPFPPGMNTVFGSKKLSDEQISDAYERHLQWSKENGHDDPDTVKALREHEKAKGITRAEANGIADLQYVGGGDSDWRSMGHRDERTAMSTQYREAELLQAMANSPKDAPVLLAELDRIRTESRLRHQADTEIDLANAFIGDVLTPVMTHSHHTASTDWLDEMPTDSFSTAQIVTTASLWYQKLSNEVRSDRTEFLAQAQGIARKEASQHGSSRDDAYRVFMDHVARIHQAEFKTANSDALLPWSVVLPPLPPQTPLGAEFRTDPGIVPGNPGQPQPLYNDAEHAFAFEAESPSNPQSMAEAGQVNYMYPNQDATREPNDDGALQGSMRGNPVTSAHLAVEEGENPFPSWPIGGGQVEPVPFPINNPADIASASSRENLPFYPNQDATDEPNDDGNGTYSDKGEALSVGGHTASERFDYPRSSYEAYTKRIAEGSAVVPQEFWGGMAAAVSAPVDPRIITANRKTAGTLPVPHVRAMPGKDGKFDVWHVWSPSGVSTVSRHYDQNEAERAAKAHAQDLGAAYVPNGGRNWSSSMNSSTNSTVNPMNVMATHKRADFDDPTGSQIGHNPPAWNNGPEDRQQAYEQSGNAQSGLPFAPEGQMAETFSNLTEFPNTGPTEVPSDRVPWLKQQGPDMDSDALDDSVGRGRSAAKKDDGTETGGRGDVPGAYQPDRGAYAESPQGQADSTEGYEHAYSSGRPINWTDTGESTLGTVPVQGYGLDEAHPQGQMWTWDLDDQGLPSGAADVADVPAIGVQTGIGAPQPNIKPRA